MEGYLLKWVNYVYGWKKRYFVLHNGVVYYCKDKGEKSKGAIHLNVAQVVPHPKNNKRLQIDTGCTVVHLKAETSEECFQWLKSLREEQVALSHMAENQELRDAEAPNRISSGLQTLAAKLGGIWTLQAQLEEQIDLLGPAVKGLPQLQSISTIGMNLKVGFR